MANIYCHGSDYNQVIITNTPAYEGETPWVPGTASFNSVYVTVELTDDKFILPQSASKLFYYASGITADFTKFDTSQCTDMSYMFYNAPRQTACVVDMSNWDLSNVTTMEAMFANENYPGYADVIFGNHLESTSLTNISKMFYRWTRGSTLDLSGMNTSNVTTMNSMFTGCDRLKTLDISNFDISSCDDVGDMFLACIQLKEIYAGEAYWNNKTFTNDTNMFSNCGQLRNFDSRYTDSTRANSGEDGYFSYFEFHGGVEHEAGIKENDIGTKVEVFI